MITELLQDARNTAIFLAVFLAFVVQLYYYVFVFGRIRMKVVKKRLHNISKTEEPVSIILCIQQDTENADQILTLLLEQNYPKYEVIVIIDKTKTSINFSEEILMETKGKYPYLEIRNLNTVNNSVHGKSVMLGVGVKAAKYDRIILTDLNCRFSLNWLKSMSSGFNADIFLSYTRYTRDSFLRITNFHESLFKFGFALKNRAYTGSGENSGFNKRIFFEKGFSPFPRNYAKTEQVFFNSVTKPDNTVAVLFPDAINSSVTRYSFREWCIERSKEIHSTELFCKHKHIKTPELVSRIIFYSGIIAIMSLQSTTSLIFNAAAGILLLRLLIQFTVFYIAQKTLNETFPVFKAVFWDFCSIFVNLYIYLFVKGKVIKRLKKI